MRGKKSKAKAGVQAPGDPHPPPKPAPLARTTHVPTKEVVDEYVKVVGVEMWQEVVSGCWIVQSR